MKKLLLVIGLLAASIAFSSRADAQLYLGIGIRIGPPPARVEVIGHRPYRGAVWIAGCYDWHPARREYVWVPGHWVRPPRPYAVWVPGRWSRRHHEWVFYEGHWRDQRPGRVRREGEGR